MRTMISAVLLSLLAVRVGGAAEVAYAELKPPRIEEIAGMLADQPAGFGRPATDRVAWSDPQLQKLLADEVREAEKLLTEPFPRWDDAAYLDFSRTGSRRGGEAMLRQRAAWLRPLVLAECLQNRGRFVSRLNMILAAYAAEPTWTLPAHDGNLDCFRRKSYTVDLRAATFGHELAQALYLLGDKVRPDVRQKVREALETRLFAPVRASCRTGEGHWWLTGDNNWNAVCLAGVTGAALTVLPDRNDRAVFVAAAEHYSRHYIGGFSADGYCVEGVGYWNYGFGSYVRLREQLWQATTGRIDLFADPKVRNIALFGARIRLNDSGAPPFSDCRFGTTPEAALVRYCDRVLGLGLSCDDGALWSRDGLTEICMGVFASSATTAKAGAPPTAIGLRSYFDQPGVLVCRPQPGAPCRLAVAIKGGGNGSHSHNDIGSFVIALGREQLVGDPGGPHAYTRATFGPHRYDSQLLNSFGHPVPVVAGKLQRDAAKVRPKVLATRFTDAQDEISFDIAPAYAVPELEKLVRTVRYNRDGLGTVTVEDEFTFSQPATFDVALPTHGRWRKTGPQRLEFTAGSERLVATVETPDGFDVTSAVIHENAPPFTRLGLRLTKPRTAGLVRVVFQPQPSTVGR